MGCHSWVAVLCACVLALGIAAGAVASGDHSEIRVVAAAVDDWSGVEDLSAGVDRGGQPAIDSVELTVVAEALTVRPLNGLITVCGEVRNDGDSAVSALSLQVVALDGDGHLLDTGQTPLPASSPAVPWNAPVDLLAAGATGLFSVTLGASVDDVATVLVRALGIETDLVPGELTLELVGDWDVQAMPQSIQLAGRVRNPTASGIAGLAVTVAAREPSGAVLAVGRSYPRASMIGGYRGGLRPGEEAEVDLTLFGDPAELATAELETVVTGRPYGGGSFRYGVVGLAHSPGAGGSVWRSSLALTNRSGAPAGVELRYVFSEGREERSLQLADGETFHRDDVVRTLFGVNGSSAGYVQIASSTPLTVAARTSNQLPAGTFGQALPVYTPEMTIELMGAGVLSGLRGGAGFRSNIGLVNMSASDCECRVRLVGPRGELLREWPSVGVGPSSWRQLNDVMPANAELAAAVVAPGSGCWMWAYASVIDEATGDPTTIVVEPTTVIDLTPYPYRRPGAISGSWAGQDVPAPPGP
jgi:hypothetical protein